MATRRTRTAGKVEIPNVDDHVSKLEHMGKETVKKLQDIKGSAVQSGIDINVPDNRIDKGARTCLQPDYVASEGLGRCAALGTDQSQCTLTNSLLSLLHTAIVGR